MHITKLPVYILASHNIQGFLHYFDTVIETVSVIPNDDDYFQNDFVGLFVQHFY